MARLSDSPDRDRNRSVRFNNVWRPLGSTKSFECCSWPTGPSGALRAWSVRVATSPTARQSSSARSRRRPRWRCARKQAARRPVATRPSSLSARHTGCAGVAGPDRCRRRVGDQAHRDGGVERVPAQGVGDGALDHPAEQVAEDAMARSTSPTARWTRPGGAWAIVGAITPRRTCRSSRGSPRGRGP
jgi:hypothetical protein